MPTYTYACKQCGHRFDQRQSFTDPALTTCPQCAGNLRKVLNSVGVVFKGSGFYRTDSRSGPQASKPAPAQASQQAAGSAKSESSAQAAGSAKAEGSAKTAGSAGAGAKKPVAANA
jgi:putative FmdB family regulatory protein